MSLASSKPSIYTCVFYVLTIHRFVHRDASHRPDDSTLPTLVCITLVRDKQVCILGEFHECNGQDI